jgi:pimeloyl-[acyl-carrier protein] synthase
VTELLASYMTVATSEPGHDASAAVWRALADEPVRRVRDGVWIVGGHREALQLLRDRTVLSAGQRRTNGVWNRLAQRFMMFLDGESHRAARGLAAPLISPQRLGDVKDELQETMRGHIGRFCGGLLCQDADVLRELAFPATADLLGRVFALDPAERDFLLPWSQDVLAANDDSALDACADALRKFFELRLTVHGSLLARLAAKAKPAESEGGALISCACLLTVAGFETTANFFGNALLGVLWRPDRYQALVEYTRGTPTEPVDELLRLFTPAHIVRRRITRAVLLDTASMRPNDEVAICLSACNRDPRVFTSPTEVRFDRDPNPHLSFAHGGHYCLGAGLARLEIGLLLRGLCESAPRLRLSSGFRPEWTGRLLGRGLRELRVSLA